MAVVAVAIVISFHLKSQPTALELRMARPLGIVFWLLSILTLFVGVANYISACFVFRSSTMHTCCMWTPFLTAIETVNKYSRRQAIVQSGWKTQSVCCTFRCRSAQSVC